MAFTHVDGTMAGMNCFSDDDQIQNRFLGIHSSPNKPNTKNCDNKCISKINNKGRFLCEYPGCMKRFKDNHHLKVHQRKHTGEKPFNCEYPGCKRKFSQKNNLKQHQRIHNGEKPYECEACHKNFRQLTHLQEHNKKNHKWWFLEDKCQKFAY
ncbi:hypothetical protein C1645_353104 [Glomus cerebriforme]|uniref:C2H2-type domain-containing protein n=1 Tax=Glomus cerebriforme TaxID=658196 RepID=A0A397TJU7_9GLOM|nr:hypothetical protein C1645_353104 [Glomus cerebriforme]